MTLALTIFGLMAYGALSALVIALVYQVENSCPGCGESFTGEGYDPDGRERYCSEECHWSACEREGQRAYERFHEGGR